MEHKLGGDKSNPNPQDSRLIPLDLATSTGHPIIKVYWILTESQFYQITSRESSWLISKVLPWIIIQAKFWILRSQHLTKVFPKSNNITISKVHRNKKSLQFCQTCHPTGLTSALRPQLRRRNQFLAST